MGCLDDRRLRTDSGAGERMFLSWVLVPAARMQSVHGAAGEFWMRVRGGDTLGDRA